MSGVLRTTRNDPAQPVLHETGTQALASDALDRIAEVATQLADRRTFDEAEALRERVADGRFYVACLGQFKRGKSTLINALIGADLLPSGIVPITNVPTVVRYGECARARLRIGQGPWQDIPLATLEQYVSETRNAQNAAGVTAIEVFAPGELLRDGLCLVDTPGVGSVFVGSTAATRDFVPHIDAALIVIGADPPLSGEELALVREVATHTPDILVVMSKADRADEQARTEAARFADGVLAEALGRRPRPILQVSATERLVNLGPPRDWPALICALREVSNRSGRDLVQAALKRGVSRLATECVRQIDQVRDALLRPIEESEQRLDSLGRLMDELGHRSIQLGHVFDAEQEALARTFAVRRQVFLDRATPEMAAQVVEAVRQLPARHGPTLRRMAMARAQMLVRERVEPWLAQEQSDAETAYRETAAHLITVANAFLDQVAATAELSRTVDVKFVAAEQGFRHASRFSFHDLPVVVSANARGQWWLDRLRTPHANRRAATRDATSYARQLLEVNTTRVQNDLDERVLESRRHLEEEVHAVLLAAHESAGRAVDLARRTLAAGSDAVTAMRARLDALRGQVEGLDV